MRILNDIGKLAQFYPVLQELPPNLQQSLVESSYPLQAAAGQVLFDVDVTIQSFILLTQGAIRVIRPEIDRELLLYHVRPGGCCAISISHLLGDTRFHARAIVEEDIRGAALPLPLFQEMIRLSPAFSYFVLRGFSDRFNQMLELIGRITSMRLDQRLARMLLSRGTVIRTTHTQLADDLGSVREVISRILKDFEGKGWVKVERGHIQILDPEALQSLYGIGDSGHRL